MRQIVNLAVRNYFNLYLGKFNAPFRYSSLSRLIDLSSNSIVSNRINTTIYKKIVPSPVSAGNYTLYFDAPIFHPYDAYAESIVKTSVFKHKDVNGNIRDCFIEDNGSGRLIMYRYNGLDKVVVRNKLGTIDYATGKVVMSGFNPVGTGSIPYITFEVTPDQRVDIIPKRNQVLLIDNNSPNPIKISFVDTATGNY
jgi:hypothetical protein